MKLVECVPNFSEGQDQTKIDLITKEIRETENVSLLDVDPGKDTNRTVVTFVGEPEAVIEAAFKAIVKATEIIDMRSHQGAHARIGATDVCPLIPVSDITMEECAVLARKLGERVGRELKIPVYLYEHAASSPERQNLADIRSGEYEGLSEKLKDPAWKPDFGPAEFNPKTGATVIGAREFLIAYNINLNTRDVRIAREIAFTIREKGRLKRDQDGKVVHDENGRSLRVPGKFKAVKAVGWVIEDFGLAQISINFVNYKITPPHLVFDECVKLADDLGARVTGSELVGLIPLEAMIQAGEHYLKKMGKTSGVPESELIHTAVLSLGLNDLYPFEPNQKIIEYQVGNKDSLIHMRMDRFIDLLSSESPAPGGGSVAAMCGALSGALTSMVASLTYGKQGYEEALNEMEEIGVNAQKLKDDFLHHVSRDTEAFNRLMETFRLPKKTEEDKAVRLEKIEQATREATLVPLEVLRCAKQVGELARRVVEKGNKNSISDGGVAALCARTAGEGAYLNVRINLINIRDEQFKKETLDEAERLRWEVAEYMDETVRKVEKILGEM